MKKLILINLCISFAFTMAANLNNKPNLTLIKFAHAVNSKEDLDDSLSDDEINFLEADVVLGILKDDPFQRIQPIMSHDVPVSEISLEQFLNTTLQFNQLRKEPEQKGIKLDFKSTEAFKASLPIIGETMPKISYPFWINADIIPGPVENVDTVPVDAFIFLEGCKRFPKAVISSGWTTRWGQNFTDGRYTVKQIFQMIEALEKSNVSNQSITFPVRAGIALNSYYELQSLYQAIKDNNSNQVTFTIWSGKEDFVESAKLNNFICNVGVDKVYVDVPEELEEELNFRCNKGSSFAAFGGWQVLALIGLHMILIKMLY